MQVNVLLAHLPLLVIVAAPLILCGEARATDITADSNATPYSVEFHRQLKQQVSSRHPSR
jgi:hypothetical protein